MKPKRTPKTWKNLGTFFDYKGHSIFYVEGGQSDKTLICIHGFPTSSWDWVDIWDGLTKDFKVIAIDLIGFGFSDKPKEYDYSILDQADLIETLVEKLGIQESHILAHDYGDTVAQELLARQKEGSLHFDIQSVCLLNGGIFPDQHRPRLIQKLLASSIGQYISKLITPFFFNRSFSAVFAKTTRPSKQQLHDFWSIVNYNEGKLIYHKLIHYMSERKKHKERWVNVLESPLEPPIRLINGAKDPVSGIHVANYYKKINPSADVIVLKEIGHYPQVEAPRLVLESFNDFHAL